MLSWWCVQYLKKALSEENSSTFKITVWHEDYLHKMKISDKLYSFTKAAVTQKHLGPNSQRKVSHCMQHENHRIIEKLGLKALLRILVKIPDVSGRYSMHFQSLLKLLRVAHANFLNKTVPFQKCQNFSSIQESSIAIF